MLDTHHSTRRRAEAAWGSLNDMAGVRTTGIVPLAIGELRPQLPENTSAGEHP